ncbi:site-specific integrase [Nguyenibacter vanlangensis]|uniref:site-specific integrase n=1 Tax=Nguyenibacter vanlangensis TaxID=1216886 RepID=UPI001C4004E9|nr:tyrosine-type recombinase/integrase [Nguyenibacter vanlangensis]
MRYIHRVKDRYGRLHFYLRRPGHKSIALPHENDPGFISAYQAALATTEAAVAAPKIGTDTLGALIEAWQVSAHFRQLGQSTQSNYRRILARMGREDYATHKVRDFEAMHVRRFVARAAETPAAANHRLRLFRMLFRFAVDDGWIDKDPTIGVRRLKEKGEGAKSWSEAEITRFEHRWAPGTQQRLAFSLLLYTGQRRSDVVKMGWDDVEDGLLRVHQIKTGAALLIPIHEMLLREIERCDPAAPRFLMTREGRSKPYSPNGFYNHFVEWVEAAGLPAGLSPHGLRKAAARRLAESGCTPHQIAAITGHKTLSEVERYTRAVDQVRLAREAMERIARVKLNPGVCKTPD